MEPISLIEVICPTPGSTILVCDVHASESGALSILNDFYEQVKSWPDKSVNWWFIVSTPKYEEKSNIKILRYPWIKKGWFYRLIFDLIYLKKIINKIAPQKVFSLQNKGLSCFKGPQYVYLHLPFVLTDHRFSLKKDGKTLWIYQNIISRLIFSSLRKVDYTIVQTAWMKNALKTKANISDDKILILSPDISTNSYWKYKDSIENRKSFFYPATAFTYKNHFTLLKALLYAQDRGLTDYNVTFTIRADENDYTKKLYDFSKKNSLNVDFKGPIRRDEVFKFYSESVLLFPSYVESFGLPLLEAKITGCYIIASDTPFSREILFDYDKASFFDELDYEQMGKEIIELQKK